MPGYDDKAFQRRLLGVLGNADMRAVLFYIMDEALLFLPSYAPGDPYATAHNEGLRAVALWLKQEIDNADPEAFAQMLRENLEHRKG